MRTLEQANAQAINNDDRNQPPDESPPRKPPKPRKRRDYAGELSELRSAVITAVRLLRKVQPSNELVNVAIELLEP